LGLRAGRIPGCSLNEVNMTRKKTKTTKRSRTMARHAQVEPLAAQLPRQDQISERLYEARDSLFDADVLLKGALDVLDCSDDDRVYRVVRMAREIIDRATDQLEPGRLLRAVMQPQE
jgi:hypothetical protein